MNIIGISAGYHDSACCLMRDGRIVAAAQEERFTRIKNDKAFPAAAFRFCLDDAAISIADVDCVAFYEDPRLKLGRQLWMAMLPNLSKERRALIRSRALGSRPDNDIARVAGYDGPVEIVDHHLSHAASAYFFSGFEHAAILTVDGVGEWATTTYNVGHGKDIIRLGSVDFPHSLGLFYSTITAYLGFEVNEGEYKVMGLAPYGQPIYADRIRDMIVDRPGGDYHLNLQYYSFLSEDAMYSDDLVDLLGAPPRKPGGAVTQFHMDVARSAQMVLEDLLLAKVRWLHGQVDSDNLCMAGGVALNVVANSRCLKDGPFKRLFVQPAAGDAGGCIGAAAVAHVRRSGTRPSAERLSHVYLGPSNSISETYSILSSSGVKFLDFRDDEAGLLRCVVDRLIQGQVVAWVSGRMEFGPRSLGARSILADPRRPDMRDRINALIKQRESFRPFAPAVLADHALQHFDLDHPSPFMLETCQVVSPIALPAVTHVDGSARIQTVTRTEHARFSKLLECFYEHTRCPILLNTSLNLRGEPIVCSGMDAISTFARSQMEVLVLDDFVVEQIEVPSAWRQLAPRSRLPSQDYLVYAML